ncbi:MAG: Ig-like domain-containing protein, partial [Planctomycetaceae bacterium]|nr:Ig-like domain-containing protein [Planctomycetaceae bacterium]
TFTFVPVSGFSGVVTFRYAITDSVLTSKAATVTLSVLEDGIIAADGLYVVRYGQSLPIDVLANVLTRSGQGNVSSLLALYGVSLLSGPDNGTVQIAQDGSFVYGGDTGFTGTDSFVYRLTDALGNHQDATVTLLVVADALTAHVEVLTLESGGSVQVADLFASVTANEFNQGNALSDLYQIVLKGAAQYGTATLDSAGNLTYAAPSNEKGAEIIDFEIVDNEGNAIQEGSLLFVVLPQNSGNLQQVSVPSGYNTDPQSNSFGTISVGGTGYQFGGNTPFIPQSIGSYRFVFDVTQQNIGNGGGGSNGGGSSSSGSSTGSASHGGSVVCWDLGNGDWFYSETVYYCYSISDSGNAYYGGYTSVLVASFIAGVYSYSYHLSTSDHYLITETVSEQSGTSYYTMTGRVLGGKTETVFMTLVHDTNTTQKTSSERRTLMVSDGYVGTGSYGYATEGGFVNGTLAQFGAYRYKASIHVAGTGTGSNWITTVGVQSSSLMDSWDSFYSGTGTYSTVSQSSGSYSSMSGVISESGHSSSQTSLSLMALLPLGIPGPNDDWVFTGDGMTTRSSGNSYYSCGSGEYWKGSSQPGDSWFISGTHGTEVMAKSDDHEVILWLLVDDQWTAFSGDGHSTSDESSSYHYSGSGEYFRSGGTVGNAWSSWGTLTQSGKTFDESSQKIEATLIDEVWSFSGTATGSGLDEYDFSSDGNGVYTKTILDGGTEFKFSGTTTEYGTDVFSMSYKTTGTLSNGTWTSSGTGDETGSWSNGFAYDGAGTFTMKFDDPNIVSGFCYGKAQESGNNDASSSWNVDWSMLDGEWKVDDGDGRADYTNAYNSSYFGGGTTWERYTKNGIEYSTKTNWNVNGHDNGEASSWETHAIANDSWVISDGFGSGTTDTRHYRDGTITGTYFYKQGNAQEGHKANGTVNGTINDTKSIKSEYTSEWLNETWSTTGFWSFDYSDDGSFNTAGTGTFWIHSPNLNIDEKDGTIDEKFNSHWKTLSKWKETYDNGVIKLDSGTSTSTSHEDSRSDWDGKGTFTQYGYGTTISGDVTVKRNITNTFDATETHNVVAPQSGGDKEWLLSSGEMASENTYSSETIQKNGKGTLNTGGKSYAVTSSGTDTVDEKENVSGEVKSNEWFYSGTASSKLKGESESAISLKSGYYSREILGGWLVGTAKESEETRSNYEEIVESELAEGATQWAI